MRRVLGTLMIVLLFGWLPANAQTSGHSVVRASGPSPYPSEGCGQADTVVFGTATGSETDASVVVNPGEPNHIVAAWVQDEAMGIVAATSFDGGLTWMQSDIPGLTVCNGGPDARILHARLAFGPDGRLYLAGETLNGYFPDPRSGINQIPVVTSADGGLTWSDPVLVNETPFLNGLDTIAAEPDVPGAAVIAWHTPEPVASSYLARTTDGGQSWTHHPLPSYGPDSLPFNGVVAAPDGTIHVFFTTGSLRSFPGSFGLPTTAQDDVYVTRSSDKGLTWSDPVLVAHDVVWHWPGAGVAPDGDMFVGIERQGEDGGREFTVARSTDNGLTWSEGPVVATVHGPMPKLAVGTDGSLGVGYQVNENGQTRVLFARSTNAGLDWTHTVLADAFETPAYPGFYQETVPAGDGFATIFIGTGEDTDGPTDAYVAIVE